MPIRRIQRYCWRSARCFHPYLLKYLTMICRGHVPILGSDRARCGSTRTLSRSSSSSCRRMRRQPHQLPGEGSAAFPPGVPRMEPEEIYDVLMTQLISAANGYDPYYKDKLRKVAKVIQHVAVNRRMEFDCTRHLPHAGARWLPRNSRPEDRGRRISGHQLLQTGGLASPCRLLRGTTYRGCLLSPKVVPL